MKTTILSRLLATACLATVSSIAVAQGTTPGTTPTNPAPESMGTPASTPNPNASTGSMNGGSMAAMPTAADCKQMMADHQKNPSMKMDDGMKSKMKMCSDMKRKPMSSTDSSKMN